MKIARVFPRRTNLTPVDDLAFVGEPPLIPPEVDEVHISVLFSWDLPEAERISVPWGRVAPVKIGGPATGDSSGEFIPGRYVRHGAVVTSRGCPNSCWFCCVPKIEGRIQEMPIHDGFNILDSNLLACSDLHVDAVFAMLKRQKNKPEFTGGLEAKRITPAIARKLRESKPEQLFCAYDTPDDLEPLVEAGKNLKNAGFTSRYLRAYVLCGWENDTFEKATARMVEAWMAGFLPMAMAFHGEAGHPLKAWERYARKWSRPAITRKLLKELTK